MNASQLDPPASREASGVNLTNGSFSVARCRQVFGLASSPASAVFLLPTASQPEGPVQMVGVVLAYRCGAAPDSHRVPF